MPQKKTNSRSKKTSSKLKKPKVYIPAYKIIMLCVGIITICMALLLITTITVPKNEPKIAVTQPETKQEPVKTEQKTEPAKETKAQPKVEVKVAPKKETKAAPKVEAKVQPPKVEVKTEVKKTETKPVEVKTEVKVETKPQLKQETKTTPKSEEPKKADMGFNFPTAKNGAQLIFVFDDGGQNMAHLKPFLQLPFPITIAVLPKLAHSVDFANQIRQSGNELILHQPMQSVSDKVNPGPGAIKPGMSEDEITSLLFQNINEIGPIAGLNNHEGSAITADAEMMAVVMRVASESGIYFLDSRTNVETKVPYVAKEMGYSYYERNIFLDNEKTRENALKELNKGLAIANKNGSVIMIGHIWSADFLPEFLQEAYPELVKKGYTFSVVSKSKARK